MCEGPIRSSVAAGFAVATEAFSPQDAPAMSLACCLKWLFRGRGPSLVIVFLREIVEDDLGQMRQMGAPDAVR